MTEPQRSDQSPEHALEAMGDARPSGISLPKIVDFKDLSRCGDEIWISHNGTLYRLRSTKQGKLILTK